MRGSPEGSCPRAARTASAARSAAWHPAPRSIPASAHVEVLVRTFVHQHFHGLGDACRYTSIPPMRSHELLASMRGAGRIGHFLQQAGHPCVVPGQTERSRSSASWSWWVASAIDASWQSMPIKSERCQSLPTHRMGTSPCRLITPCTPILASIHTVQRSHAVTATKVASVDTGPDPQQVAVPLDQHFAQKGASCHKQREFKRHAQRAVQDAGQECCCGDLRHLPLVRRKAGVPSAGRFAGLDPADLRRPVTAVRGVSARPASTSSSTAACCICVRRSRVRLTNAWNCRVHSSAARLRKSPTAGCER